MAQLGKIDQKLQELGYPLDRVPKVGAIYQPVVIDGTTVYCAGSVPFDGDVLTLKGKVPSQVGLAAAQKGAALCVANMLRNVRNAVGTLDKVDRILRVMGYVNCDLDYTEQHLVINGASQLLVDLFGEKGLHARTAVGMAALPLGSSVEVDMILKLKS
ncbi:MAG TPA: RidA family protein [Planctomycetota bacterium]|nr:RidA family protein [Planctomycetota bacterium]